MLAILRNSTDSEDFLIAIRIGAKLEQMVSGHFVPSFDHVVSSNSHFVPKNSRFVPMGN